VSQDQLRTERAIEYGVCTGAVTWGSEQGSAGTIDVSGLVTGEPTNRPAAE
jgi:hypothetical protein